MPRAVRYTKPEVQERIARDYVIGSLSAAARRRCESLRMELPDLDQKIHKWSEHLQPMADAVPDLVPGNAVWERIDASINKASLSPEPVAKRLSLWDRLSFVRGLALAASILVVALALIQVTQDVPPSVDYVAVLANDAGQPRIVATASEVTKKLQIRIFGDALDSESDYQLWALSKTDGEIRSLGLLDAGSLSQRQLNETDWRLIIDAHELLVTAEMPGGSPIGEPSDDVISRGLCVRLSAG